ncbi:MAG: hypothetical protein WAO98_08985 [Alphaproteobacteria bacterium]
MKKSTLLFLLCPLIPSLAHAQASAPALYGVQEVVYHYAQFPNAKDTETCKMNREDIAASIKKILKGNNINALSVTEAKPPMMGIARIELIPEVTTSTKGGLDCTSFISLTARTKANVKIPPIETMRHVTIIYWQQTAMIPTDLSVHATTVLNGISKMAEAFAQQYHIDQPPALPTIQP